MLAKILKANEDRKNAAKNRQEEDSQRLKEIKKKEDAKHVAVAFDNLKNWISDSIQKGACLDELTITLSYSSTKCYGEVYAGAFFQLLIDQSYAIGTLFENDPVFAPLFTSFKSWCNSEGLEVKWVYKERDYGKWVSASSADDYESSWSMVFSLANSDVIPHS